ncbi:MAG: S-methyl-5'-thioadenosine phosphorylase [Deinococcus sp.]|nr:S-methyl-5'-thioadenosine phosphorylase [Deinococcus sp.]
MAEATIGIIGGSGLYQMPGLSDPQEVRLRTPFGDPSDAYVVGTLQGRQVAFLARHARGHRISPSELNFRANIYGFKLLGVERLISVGAVGSLHERHRPLDLVIPNQFVDRTKGRIDTFFRDGIVAHVSMADPVCAGLAASLAEAAQAAGLDPHVGGIYLCMEGPAFSTRAESELYRSWGMDVIGMTNFQEAKLAREAELCYATLAFVTDYDCWHVSEEKVSAEMVITNLLKNVQNAQALITQAVRTLPPQGDCPCGRALEQALVTDLKLVPKGQRSALRPIIGKYLERAGL